MEESPGVFVVPRYYPNSSDYGATLRQATGCTQTCDWDPSVVGFHLENCIETRCIFKGRSRVNSRVFPTNGGQHAPQFGNT